MRLALGTPTEASVVETSTAGLAMVAAAAAVHEALRAVLERQCDLLGEPVVGIPPVREETANVRADLFTESRHGVACYSGVGAGGCLEPGTCGATMPR